MSVSDWAGSVSDWQQALEGLKGFFASAFKRSEQRASAGVFIDGLLSGAERKTCWMLAEEAGLARPYRIQSLLGRSSWSADALSARVWSYARDAPGDPDGVLVVDGKPDQRMIRGIIRPANGFLKKGAQSVGGARR